MTRTPGSVDFSITTPIEEFTNPSTSSIIDIVSTIHIGSHQYYGDLHDYLHRRASEGFMIGEEAMRESTPEELAEASRLIRLKHRLQTLRSKFAIRGIVAVLDSDYFTHQLTLDDKLREDPDIECINVDVSELDVVRQEGFYRLLRSVYPTYVLSRRIERASANDDNTYKGTIYSEIAKELISTDTAQAKSAKRSVLVDYRNEVVLSHVDKRLADDPAARIALVWGYGHRKGLTEGILERGYRLTKVTAMTVAVNPAIYA